MYSTSCPLAPTSWHCPEIPPVTIDQEVYPTYNVGGTSTNIALTSQPSTFLDETSTSSISTSSPTTITNSISTDTNFDGTISTEKLPSSSNAPSAVATTTTDQCMCPCSNFHNTTTDEIMQRLEKIIADIQVDPKLTSRALRKLKCAQDDRTSARNVGLLGIFLLVGFGGIVILLDCTRVFQNVTRIRKKIRVLVSKLCKK